MNGGFGGPIVRDRLWFFTTARYQTNTSYIAGLYFPTDPKSFVRTEDKSRQGFDDQFLWDFTTRLTAASHEDEGERLYPGPTQMVAALGDHRRNVPRIRCPRRLARPLISSFLELDPDEPPAFRSRNQLWGQQRYDCAPPRRSQRTGSARSDRGTRRNVQRRRRRADYLRTVRPQLV